MARPHGALVLVLAAPVALYAAVILPREIPADYGEPTSPAAYFPTAVGSRWVFRRTESGGHSRHRSFDVVKVVTSATQRSGDWFVTVQQVEGDDPGYHEFWVSESGVSSRRLPDPWRYEREPEPWRPISRTPLAPGETWTEDQPEGHSRTVYTVVGWETVRVPAGAYRALRTNFVLTDYERGTNKALDRISGTFWNVPGIGEVKMVFSMAPFRFKLHEELVSFTPGNR